MIVITGEIESEFVAKDDLVPFRCSPVSLFTAPLQTVASRVAHVMCPAITNVLQPGAFIWFDSEGATCVWMAAFEAAGCTHAFLTMWWSSRRLDCRGRLEPGLRVNDMSQIHWSQHLLTTQSEQPN
ncbi:uncharacterized protein TNCV_3127161 [Trichonephila clavipes]|nr:uncharacterized protein TNCV_3127161 [Trichonephila clavipes]